MRRKSKRRDRYIGGTASARVRGLSFLYGGVYPAGNGEYLDYAWKIMAWMPCRCPCSGRKGGGVGEKKVCPLCGRRLLDVRRDRAYEVAFELRCPHCGKIVRIVLPARAGLRN